MNGREFRGAFTTCTVIRIQVALPDLGVFGLVPPLFGSWKVPAGGSVNLFEETYLGEPNFYITNGRWANRLRVTVSYVDAARRPGDVAAETRVSPD